MVHIQVQFIAKRIEYKTRDYLGIGKATAGVRCTVLVYLRKDVNILESVQR